MEAQIEIQNGIRIPEDHPEPESSNSSADEMELSSDAIEGTRVQQNRFMRISSNRLTSYRMFSEKMYVYVRNNENSANFDATSKLELGSSEFVEAVDAPMASAGCEMRVAGQNFTNVANGNSPRTYSRVPRQNRGPVTRKDAKVPGEAEEGRREASAFTPAVSVQMAQSSPVSSERVPSASSNVLVIEETPEMEQGLPFCASAANSSKILYNCVRPKATHKRDLEAAIIGTSVELIPVSLQVTSVAPEAAKDICENAHGTPRNVWVACTTTGVISNDHQLPKIISSYSLPHNEFHRTNVPNAHCDELDTRCVDMDCSSRKEPTPSNKELMGSRLVNVGSNTRVEQQTSLTISEVLDCGSVLRGTKRNQLQRLQFPEETMVNVWKLLCESFQHPTTMDC